MDNSNLAAKLELRRYFLRKYHAGVRLIEGKPIKSERGGEPRRVFDAFQAQGRIWAELRKDYELDSYWGVDLVEKKGRLQVDSARVLVQPGWRENIIDLDAYGSPWKHWQNMLRTADHSLTVFLTLGSRKGIQKRPLTKVEKDLLGIPFKLPPAIGGRLSQMTWRWMLAQACDRFTLVEALEAATAGDQAATARYFGVRLEIKS